MLCIGGHDNREEIGEYEKNGCDIIMGTPGKLSDLIKKDKIQLGQLQLLVLDEAERMLELSFQQELQIIYSKITKRETTNS